jgi:hypothetical protein
MLAWCWCYWEAVPFCLGWWAEKVLVPVLLAGGVGFAALWQIRVKRRGDYALEQLTKFYAPILGMSSALAAHRRGDQTLKDAGSKAHSDGIKKAAAKERSGKWGYEEIEAAGETTKIVEKFFEEELPARFTKERVDMYIKMRDFFTANFGFADEDTRSKYYGDLYDEVEKMRVYRDSVGKDSFLPGMREVLGGRVNMRRLESFHSHLERKVRHLVRVLKRETWRDSMRRKRDTDVKQLEQIRESAAMAFDQAYRLLEKFGWSSRRIDVPTDVDSIDMAVMSVFRELESAREEIDRLEWEKTNVDNSETGQDIIEKLDEILNRLNRKD